MSSYHTTEAQADTLDAARYELRSKVAPGHVVLKETVLDDGLPKTVKADATSVNEALQKAKAKVPANATIEKDNVIRQPTQETLEVVAFHDDEARQKADVRHPRKIQSISMKHPGRKGVFGIGQRPSTFAIVVIQTAEVAITYRRPASIRATTATADMIPALKETFWESGGPIRREGLYEEQQTALLGLSAFAVTGDSAAAVEIRSIVTKASQVLLDIGEFSRYHGYQRQQVAAEILGLVGSAERIPALEDALRLQETHAGCSQYSNRTSTKPLVEGTIHKAIGNLKTAKRETRPAADKVDKASEANSSARQATTFDATGGAASFKQGTLKCPKCGKRIPGEIPEMGIFICAGCRAVLNIDNYKISS